MTLTSKLPWQKLKNTLIGISLLFMLFFFLNEGLEIVNLEDLLSPVGEWLYILLMTMGMLFLVVEDTRKIRNWKRRAQPLPKPNYGEVLIIGLLALLLFSIPIVVLDHWGERLLMYAFLLLITATAILHRYFESE